MHGNVDTPKVIELSLDASFSQCYMSRTQVALLVTESKLDYKTIFFVRGSLEVILLFDTTLVFFEVRAFWEYFDIMYSLTLALSL